MAYHLDWIELVCPYCKGELNQGPARAGHVDHILTCHPCGRAFDVVCGIPDLRVAADPYISIEGDVIKGRMLESTSEASDLEAMARTYYHITPETPPRDVALNLTRLRHAVDRATATLSSLEASLGPVRGARLLEVGCGTAPMLIATADRFPHRVGVDVSFRWLVMAKRRLADHGLRLPLVAACGEALPFRAGVVDTVLMDSYLEITADQEAALGEAARVLEAGGRLVVSTPNRWSAGPDPHIGIPAGGLLPAAVVNTIAKQRMARPPLRRLLTAVGLRRTLQRAGFGATTVELARVSDAQLATVGPLGQWMGRAFNRWCAVPGVRSFLRVIGPILHASARRA